MKGTRQGEEGEEGEEELEVLSACILCSKLPQQEGFLLCEECWAALRSKPGVKW